MYTINPSPYKDEKTKQSASFLGAVNKVLIRFLKISIIPQPPATPDMLNGKEGKISSNSLCMKGFSP